MAIFLSLNRVSMLPAATRCQENDTRRELASAGLESGIRCGRIGVVDHDNQAMLWFRLHAKNQRRVRDGPGAE